MRKILEQVFFTKKCTQRKTLPTLKTDASELPDNKNFGKLFSKYKMFSLDQANSNSDPSQKLILQYPIPKASIPSLQPLLVFSLAN